MPPLELEGQPFFFMSLGDVVSLQQEGHSSEDAEEDPDPDGKQVCGTPDG